MRPGDLVRPSSNPTYPCCISTQYFRHISRAKPVSKKQGESHHQFEFIIHSGVQESATCVANDYIGQTDVPRSSQVCSGGVRRCDVNSLRVYFGRSETGHPEDLRLRTSVLPDDAVQYVYMTKV